MMQLRQKISKTAAVLLSALLVGAFGAAGHYSRLLPEHITAASGEQLKIAEYPEISCCGYPVGGGDRVALSLFGALPVKSVQVSRSEPPVLVASGMPFGIKLLMKGVMVTELGDIEDKNGESVCPAAEAGIETGDVVCLADGEEISSNGRLQTIISGSGGKGVSLRVSRGGEEFDTVLQPVWSEKNGCWRGGMWVRDSIAGIGTMTFVNRATGEFAGLGHPICDCDTGEIVPVSSGEAVPVEITGAKKGERGIPGELLGKFIRGGTYGTLYKNNEAGVYGRLSPEALEELEGEERPMAYSNEITTGDAEMIASVGGGAPEMYSVHIERIDYNSGDETKNMVIRITDRRLIEATGGIVQGMSGSPLIQNGRLIGAVTHVFVADPTRGYAIFAENMAKGLA